MCHNDQACALEPASHNHSALMSRACAPWQEKPRQQEAWAQQPETNPWSPQLKEALKTPKDPAQPKKKNFFFKLFKTQNGLSVFLSSKGRQNFYQIIIDPFFLEGGGSLGPEKETRQCRHHCSPGFLVLKGKGLQGGDDGSGGGAGKPRAASGEQVGRVSSREDQIEAPA